MTDTDPRETIVDRLVTYTVEVDGRIVIIEKVPARVCVETGEQLFSPQTVARIQDIVHGKHKPARTISTPVYEFAA